MNTAFDIVVYRPTTQGVDRGKAAVGNTYPSCPEKCWTPETVYIVVEFVLIL